MKKLVKFLMIIGVSLLMISCYYDEYLELPPDNGGGPVPMDVSFATDVQPIFTAKCSSCHNGTVADPDLRAGNAYNDIVPDHVVAGDAEASNLFIKLPGNSHPIDAGFNLSVDEIALIKAWIDEGAQNN